jgi:quinol monooxygenase YgiN
MIDKITTVSKKKVENVVVFLGLAGPGAS